MIYQLNIYARHGDVSCLLTEPWVSPVVYRVFFKVRRALTRMYGDAESEVAELMEVGGLDFDMQISTLTYISNFFLEK